MSDRGLGFLGYLTKQECMHTEPEYPRSPAATKSVLFPRLGERNDSVYSSSSICHISFLSFLKSLPRYRARARLKTEKNAKMRASKPRGLFGSFGSVLKMARSMEVLMRRWRRPILGYGICGSDEVWSRL